MLEGICTTLPAKTYISYILEKLAKMIVVAEFYTTYKPPMANEYHAEIDMTDLCTSLEASKYRSLIVSANWTIALGIFVIAYATSTLARSSTLPRKGHYKAAQRVFRYLRRFLHGKIHIDVNHSLVEAW